MMSFLTPNQIQNNKTKFDRLRAFNLPLDQYVITGSGPLGIRGLREIGDIDLIVTDQLWGELSKKYPIIDQNEVIKILIEQSIEAFKEGSFYRFMKDEKAPSVLERIQKADQIDGLSFESLEHVIYYKKKQGREKDLYDLQIIEKWKNSKMNKK